MEPDRSEERLAIPTPEFAGKHLLIDFWGAKYLTDAQVIQSTLESAARAAGAVLLHTHLHQFGGGGITGVALLAESHISIHTWPEHDYAAFDVFMCGKADTHKALAVLKEIFEPQRTEVSDISRGRLS